MLWSPVTLTRTPMTGTDASINKKSSKKQVIWSISPWTSFGSLLKLSVDIAQRVKVLIPIPKHQGKTCINCLAPKVYPIITFSKWWSLAYLLLPSMMIARCFGRVSLILDILDRKFAHCSWSFNNLVKPLGWSPASSLVRDSGRNESKRLSCLGESCPKISRRVLRAIWSKSGLALYISFRDPSKDKKKGQTFSWKFKITGCSHCIVNKESDFVADWEQRDAIAFRVISFDTLMIAFDHILMFNDDCQE